MTRLICTEVLFHHCLIDDMFKVYHPTHVRLCDRLEVSGMFDNFLCILQVYHLAHVRLRDLCDRLEISDEELQRMMWTCLEHVLVKHDLMMDRHLDQILMCAVYVMAKVMSFYRIT